MPHSNHVSLQGDNKIMRYLTQLALVTQLVYNPILLATRSYSRLLRPSMTWSFIGDSGRLLIISIWLELVVYLGVVVY